jgi:hypothetical protein
MAEAETGGLESLRGMMQPQAEPAAAGLHPDARHGVLALAGGVGAALGVALGPRRRSPSATPRAAPTPPASARTPWRASG